MKRIFCGILALALLLGLASCASTKKDWQEQYDLGMRYLKDGDYEEAILAFSAAIEIDGSRPEAYMGRAEAYIAIGEPEKALKDYKKAKRAAQNSDEDYEDLMEDLKEIIDDLENTIEEPNSWENGDISAAEGGRRLTELVLTSDGDVSTTTFTYDDQGRLIAAGDDTFVYDSQGRLLEKWNEFSRAVGEPTLQYHYDENGFLTKISGIGEGGGAGGVYENDAQGRPIRYTREYDWGSNVTEYTYSEDGRTVTFVETTTDGAGNVSVTSGTYLYDEQGRLISETGSGNGYAHEYVYSYDYLPFVATGRVNELPYRYGLNDINGHEIWSVYTDVPEKVERDEDGYLVGLSGSYGVYEFFYEDISSGDSTPAESGNAGALSYDIVREDRSQYRDSGTLAFEHYYDCVVLRGSGQIAEKINAAIREDMDDFLYTMDEESLDMYTSNLPETSYVFTTATAEVTDNSGTVFSIRIWERWFMGGVVTANCYGLNFDARTGEPVNLPALYGMEEDYFLAMLKVNAWNYLSENYASDLWNEAQDVIFGYSLEDFQCYFQNGELIVMFPPYSISYGAKGCITVPTGLYYGQE